MFIKLIVPSNYIASSDGFLIVKPLQEPLERISASLRVNYDEKPVYPDHTCNRTLVLDGDKIVAPIASKSKTWTLGN